MGTPSLETGFGRRDDPSRDQEEQRAWAGKPSGVGKGRVETGELGVCQSSGAEGLGQNRVRGIGVQGPARLSSDGSHQPVCRPGRPHAAASTCLLRYGPAPRGRGTGG